MRIAMMMLNAGRGSGEIARQHVAELLRLGHEVAFLHPGMGEGVPGADNRDVPLHADVLPVHEYLPAVRQRKRPVSAMTPAEAFAFTDDYERALEQVAAGIDVIVGHHGNLAGVATQRVAARHGKPYVLFLHGTGIEGRHHGGFAPQVWEAITAAIDGAAGIIVTTEFVRDELVRPLVPVEDERILMLPCGVDLDVFRPGVTDGIREEYGLPERYVICPGALITAKGPQNVVAATTEFADLAPIVFIGSGELRESLEAELGSRGTFLGFVPAEHKAALINAATILTAAPERLEHFGIIYIEALAAGTVPVAYGGGGVESIVTPEVGILTERDPRALGRAIREALLHPEDLERMARAGRRRAETHYSAPLLGERLAGWLQAVATGRDDADAA